MKKIVVSGNTGNSTIVIGDRLRDLSAYVPEEKIVLITDTNVSRCYEDEFPSLEIITIGTGEQIKTLDTIQYLYEKLAALDVDRSSFIVGVGGGIVCDITGFAASTYMRGIRFGFVASTLLAQVDASVGGKNGVNFDGFKNMIGLFNQPEFVICDISLLNTLPENEILCGLAEIVKHAVINDAGLFAYLEKHCHEILSLNRKIIEKLVHDSVMIKASIVNRDEKEKGERRKLNFGHTFGHAIEKISKIPHGQAVSIGMSIAAVISEKRGMIDSADTERIVSLLHKLKLPTHLNSDKTRIFNALTKDKKREGDKIHFVLIDRIGNAIVEKIPLNELGVLLDSL